MKPTQLFLIFLTIQLFSLGCTPISGEKLLEKEGLPVVEKVDDCRFKLYTCQGEIPRKGTVFLEGNEINEVKIIVERSIYTKNPLKVDEANLTKVINSMFPSKTQKGICTLDWEGKALAILEKSDSDSAEFKTMVSEYIKAIRIAKRLRPNMKWGYYGLPFKNYWNRDDNWRNRTLELLPLFKEADMIFPSIYDFYDDSVGWADDPAYVNDNVVLALEVGTRLNKPVFPFVWHRYHNSNKKKGYELIPEEEFKTHLDAALKANFQNKYIKGIVWWGADRWFYANKKNEVLKKEASKNKSFDEYQKNVLIDYTKYIHETFKENCK